MMNWLSSALVSRAKNPCSSCLTDSSGDYPQSVPTYCLRYQQPYRTVLMAVAHRSEQCVTQRIRYDFEEASEFLIYEATCHEIRLIGRCEAARSAADAQTALRKTIAALQGCDVLLCAYVDNVTRCALEQADIMVNTEYPLIGIEDAIYQIYQRMLASGDLTTEQMHIRPAASVPQPIYAF
ncbi:NifB/NifX family molybdenum-iron cluster-binding protein [Thioflexithrix psekupsensis]|nr:NifB/NifX family molybdenum-iron cluster-binding protein [Thioflexithrix psekupsensis]